jgi:hypothetical protein
MVNCLICEKTKWAIVGVPAQILIYVPPLAKIVPPMSSKVQGLTAQVISSCAPPSASNFPMLVHTPVPPDQSTFVGAVAEFPIILP